MKLKNNKLGFTLVELLIAIAIVGVLAAIGITTYSIFTQRARDAKRQADLRFIQSGLEQYFADQKHYPYQVTPDSELSFGGKKYITKVPSDPTKSPEYRYQAYQTSGTGSCTSSSNQTGCSVYCLYVYLEGSVPASDNVCITAPFSMPSSYNFGITKP